jgi:protein involved in polysaccharide export with SLBB domain
LGCLAFLALAACNEQIPLHPTAAQRFAPWTDSAPEHRLGAGDEFELRFLFNTELNDQLTIGPDGRVTVPLLGPVMAQGLTIPQFTVMLKSGYARDLRVPELDVIMRGYGSERIFVGGEVKAPGVIPLIGRIDVLQGLVLVGGVLPTARLGHIAVIRRDAQNQPMLRLVDLRHLVGNPAALARPLASGGDDFPLQAGDVVYVTRSNIADFDLFIDQYFNQALPFQKNINADLFNGLAR